MSLDGLYGFDELNAYRLDTKKGKERLEVQTSTEQALITNRGRRSGDHVYATLLPRGRVPFRRSSIKPILRCKRESSPRNVPVGGSPPEKKGSDNFFRATRECSSDDLCQLKTQENLADDPTFPKEQLPGHWH